MYIPVQHTIGILAGVLVTLALLPQLIKIWKHRSARDVSLTTYVLYCLGVILWSAYAFLEQDWLLFVFKVIGSCLSFFIIYSIFRFAGQERKKMKQLI